MRQTATLLCAAPLAALLLLSSAAFSVSGGVGPNEFNKGDELFVKVNELTSIKTQIPNSYYSLPFCKPDDGVVDGAPGLWEVLSGDREDISPYVFETGVPKKCQIVCRRLVGEEEAKEFTQKIKDEYRVNMVLDNLPLVVPITIYWGDGDIFYQRGYHIGFMGQYAGSNDVKYFIHNHLSFLVKYERNPSSGASRIVGFEVKPFSVKHQIEGKWNGVNTRLSTWDPPHANDGWELNSSPPQEIKVGEEIIFTYDVSFEETDIKWASRWDTYLSTTDDLIQMRWFSIVNSLAIILILSSTLAMTALRTLYRDIYKCNKLEAHEDDQGVTGWKLVHGDVFRPPSNPDLLCVYVGTGVQFIGALLVAMISALLGFFSPSNRATFRTAMLLIWVSMGLIAGYASCRLHKMFNGSEWKKITLRTAFLFPGVAFAVFFVSNAVLLVRKEKHSSAAVPLTTMFTLSILWSGIAVPLVFVGGYLGFNKPAILPPVETNEIPRKIPDQRAWYMHPAFTAFVAGILPFGAVFIELFLLLNSTWLGQFYQSFGLLFVAFVVLVVTCAETTVLLCYFQLRGEDYRWWWRSYLTTGCSAVYLFLYATFYFFTKLQIAEPVSAMSYFGYMLVAAFAFFVLTGTIGFMACFLFTRLIYSQGAFR